MHFFVWLLALLSLFSSRFVVAEVSSSACTTEQEVLTQVKSLVEGALGDETLQIELVPLKSIPLLKLSKMRLLSQTIQSRSAVELIGQACDGLAEQRLIAWFRVSAVKQAWVYGHQANGNQSIAAAMPRKQQVDLMTFSVSSLDLAEDITDQWLMQNVRAGFPVLKRNLQIEPLVKRDQDVTILIQGDSLQVKTRGKALRFGRLGEQIPVQMNGSQQSIMAIVRDRGVVNVEM